MYKSLLIHHNNVADVTMCDYNEYFQSTEDIDYYIHNTIIDKIKEYDFDIVFVKDSLSNTYLEFYGLLMAYHIRLSVELKNKRFVPIVILSDVDGFTLNKISQLATILFTQNMFIAPNNTKSISDYLSLKKTKIDLETYQMDFLNTITVNPPENSTSHSITNEWAIDQWSQILDITQKTQTNHEKISFMLYYKYLQTKYKLMKNYSKSIKQKQNNGKILLIDDKWAEGWKDIVSTFIQLHYTDVTFETIEKINKNSTFDEIKLYVKEKINVEDSPNIVLLDLRLLDNENIQINDTDEKSFINKISGIKILKFIKELNPSIQVIIFTASSDSMIIDEIYNNSILGYIKKDSPTDKYLASKNSFSKLDSLVKKGLTYKYLKNIYKIQEEILQLNFLKNAKLVIGQDNNTVSIKNTIPQVFDILNSNVPKPFLYAMYSIFKCIEYINDTYFREENIDGRWSAIWKDTKTQQMIAGYSTEDRTTAIIKQRLQIPKNQEWVLQLIHEIVCSRNYNIHGGEEKSNCKNGLIKSPTEKNIENWFEMLYIILEQMDITHNG